MGRIITPKAGYSSMREQTVLAGNAWYLVFLLTLLYTAAFIDRQMLVLLVRPIRADLHITDTQMSLLLGFSFAILYSVTGVWMGSLADRWSRRALIASGAVAWSIMTVSCGFAHSYPQLFLARVGVGIGEATLSPAAYSMIGDSFSRESLGRALAAYSAAVPVGAGLALVGGGLILRLFGDEGWRMVPFVGVVKNWQSMFLFIGPPGILLALLMFSVREPARRGSHIHAAQRVSIFVFLRRRWQVLACHNLGIGLLAAVYYGFSAWFPTFMVRNHGMTPADAGITYGLVLLTFGTAGTLVGGAYADRLFRQGVRDAHFRMLLASGVAIALLCTATPWIHSRNLVWLGMGGAIFALNSYIGTAPAALHLITTNEHRGQAAALYLLAVNLIGLGLGPTLVAGITDYIFRDNRSLGMSMAIVALVCGVLGCSALFSGMSRYRQAVGEANTDVSESGIVDTPGTT